MGGEREGELRWVFLMPGGEMYKSKESAVFAELLAEVFPTAEQRAMYEREVAKLVHFADERPARSRLRFSLPDNCAPGSD
jgi:hypothetical protein